MSRHDGKPVTSSQSNLFSKSVFCANSFSSDRFCCSRHICSWDEGGQTYTRKYEWREEELSQSVQMMSRSETNMAFEKGNICASMHCARSQTGIAAYTVVTGNLPVLLQEDFSFFRAWHKWRINTPSETARRSASRQNHYLSTTA